MFKGLAVGGPLDGRTIAHDGPYYRSAELNKVTPFVSFEATITDAAVGVDIFEYAHFKTPGGDVWIPAAVKAGDRYEHKIYGHPLEYVFSRLIRGYRPEGY
jgi:hypothetical protein